MRVRTPLLAGAVIGLAATLVVRRDLLVRAIREADRRGALASGRGEGGYAAASGLFAPLHARVIAESLASLVPGATLLDIGPGPGTVLAGIRAAAPGATLVGVEPSDAMRAIAADHGIDEIPGSAEALPVPDASVDLAISSLSMHHWADPAGALRELRRVLRPGGSVRIYDVRFAAYSPAEVASHAAAAGIEPGCIERTILPERILGLRPYVRITIHTPTHEESNHAG